MVKRRRTSIYGPSKRVMVQRTPTKRKNPYPSPRKTPKRQRTGSYGGGSITAGTQLATPSGYRGNRVQRALAAAAKENVPIVGSAIAELIQPSPVYKQKSRAIAGSYGGQFRKATKKSKISRIEHGGASMNIEFAKELTDTHAVYVGHSLAPLRMMRKVFLASILKKMLMKINCYVDSWDTGLEGAGLQGAAKYQWGFQFNPDVVSNAAGPGAVSFNHNTTFRTVVDSMDDGLVQYFNVNSAQPQNLQIIRSWLRTGSSTEGGTLVDYLQTPVVLELKDSEVTVDVRSYMSVQNRTKTNSGSSDTDRNDTQPLEGKVYFGKGNGPLLHGRELLDFSAFTIADDKAGLISFHPSGQTVAQFGGNPGPSQSFPSFYAPPPSSMFKGVSYTNSLVPLGPGEIRTSYLKVKKTVSCNYMFKLLFSWGSNSVYSESAKWSQWSSTWVPAIYQPNRKKLPFGEFKMFGFEKMMDIPTEGEPDITIGAEASVYCGMSVAQHKNTFTNRNYEIITNSTTG